MAVKTSNKSKVYSAGLLMQQLLTKSKTSGKAGFSKGDKVTGIVTEIADKHMTVDIGGKCEGLVAEKTFAEAKELIKELKVGDRIDAQVIVSETSDGYTILSLRNKIQERVWKELEEAYEKDLDIKVKGKLASHSGLIVDVKGLTGFIPLSHLSEQALKNTAGLLDKTFLTRVIEVDRDAKRIVLSEKFVTEKDKMKNIQDALTKVKIGDVFEGTVVSIVDFGMFVEVRVKVDDKEVPLEGLVHVSEFSWDKSGREETSYREGDKIEVKVVEIKGNKLSLSMKQMVGDPWTTAASKYKKDDKLTGRVVKISDFGAFIQLEPGIEGLVHITKIPPDKKLVRGDEIKVYVEEIDIENKKISLGLILTELPIGYK